MEPFVSTFKALGDKTRFRLVRILREGAFNVNELVGILAMGQSGISRHLKILHGAGLVRTRREGNWAYYTLSERWSGRTSNVSEASVPRRDTEERRSVRFLRLLRHELARADDPEAVADQEAIHRCLEARRQRAASFFRDVATDWDAHRDRFQGPPLYLDRLAAALGPIGTPVDLGTVVDLGTGTGILLSLLSPRARKVIGVDAATEMLQMARNRVLESQLENVELRLGALEHLPIPDAEADAMVASMVLHHVNQPPQALKEVRRGLRPGGRLLLADLIAHGQEEYRERLGDLWLGFEKDDLVRWLNEADLELEECEQLPSEGSRPDVLFIAARRRSA